MLEQFGSAERNRFSTLQAGPSRTLHHSLQAVRRGDSAIVLTARRKSERVAILTEIVRLAGPELRRMIRVTGAELAGASSARLESMALTQRSRTNWQAALHSGGTARSLLIVDEAEMLGPAEIEVLTDLRDSLSGGAVQVLLAGSSHLLANLVSTAMRQVLATGQAGADDGRDRRVKRARRPFPTGD
ncbi:ATP-binding protein [Croceicoccus ponticola]|uniref:ATP-binding protein n=1 Tax=Croceicoccus ponticola TaxID=2217664 RepID=A0A437H084_9SPHN|nr:AAA family ATPase [Croceicoccus ponticola]RVQ69015.1 ATP-binding protein [Croceicoccus ponticola]